MLFLAQKYNVFLSYKTLQLKDLLYKVLSYLKNWDKVTAKCVWCNQEKIDYLCCEVIMHIAHA